MFDKKLFNTAVSVSFGAWLAMLGLLKWYKGAAGFIGYVVKDFESTFLPAGMVEITGWAIIVLEPLLGLWLISQFKPFLAWLGTAGLMFLLITGKSLTGDYATVANNWQYLVLAIVMLCLQERKA